MGAQPREQPEHVRVPLLGESQLHERAVGARRERRVRLGLGNVEEPRAGVKVREDAGAVEYGGLGEVGSGRV